MTSFELTVLREAETEIPSAVAAFALAADNAALAACIDRHIDWLIDDGRIGFRECFDDPSIFMRRAQQPAAVER